MNKLSIAFLGLAGLSLAAAPARADLISVHGTASGFEIPPTPELAKIGFAVDLAGSFEFWYSYDSATDAGPGSFKVLSLDANGVAIDAIDLTSTTVYWHANNDPYGSNYGDEYTAGILSTRLGTQFQILVDLYDQGAKTSLPASPATYLNATWPGMLFGFGIQDPTCDPNFCEGFVANITSLSATVTPTAGADSDGDGIPDSIEALVPCAGPTSGGAWKSHGRFISELAKIAQQLVDDGLITEDQKDAIIAAGASSTCGK